MCTCVYNSTHTHTHTAVTEDQDILAFEFFWLWNSFYLYNNVFRLHLYPCKLPEKFKGHVKLYIVLIGHVMSLSCGSESQCQSNYMIKVFENRNIP